MIDLEDAMVIDRDEYDRLKSIESVWERGVVILPEHLRCQEHWGGSGRLGIHSAVVRDLLGLLEETYPAIKVADMESSTKKSFDGPFIYLDMSLKAPAIEETE